MIRVWVLGIALAGAGCATSDRFALDDAGVDGGPGDSGARGERIEQGHLDTRTDASDIDSVVDSGRIPSHSEDDGGDDSDGGSDNAPPGISYAGGDGSSCETAVIILGAESDFAGVAAEYAWLDEHYPGSAVLGQSLGLCGDHHADIIHIRTLAGAERDVYFDIEAFFGT